MSKVFMMMAAVGVMIAFNFMRTKYKPAAKPSPISVVYKIESPEVPENLKAFKLLSEEEVSVLKVVDYGKYLKKTFESLMRKQTTKDYKKEQLEKINAQMVQEGAKLSQLLSLNSKGENFIFENLQFFNDCVFERKLSLSIRGICLYALELTFEQDGSRFKSYLYPKQILEISKTAKGFLEQKSN